MARAANITLDARFTGYECHQSFDYSIFSASHSDCLDRYLSRYNELIESCRIIYGIVYVLVLVLVSVDPLPFSSSSFSIMEWLITTFLITFPSILSLINELKLSIESSKGIYSTYPNCFPYLTTYIICNDFPTSNQLNKFCRCINLGDLIASSGSTDSVLGSVDLA